MTYMITIHLNLQRAMSANPEPDDGEVDIRVRVLYDMKLNRALFYFTVPGIVISGV
jgi:hypothetical protein